jgi:hypothetical protein
MNNAVFWDVMPCGSCKNRRFGRTSVLTRAARRNIPEDGILQVFIYLSIFAVIQYDSRPTIESFGYKTRRTSPTEVFQR